MVWIQESSECTPSTSKVEKKEEYEVIDISSEEEDNWGGTPRRIDPPKSYFGYAGIFLTFSISIFSSLELISSDLLLLPSHTTLKCLSRVHYDFN